MSARSRAVEKRSIRLPSWWLTWRGRGGGGAGEEEYVVEGTVGGAGREGNRKKGKRAGKGGVG